MPVKFQMRRSAYQRIKALGFSPDNLPHDRVEACDLCGHDVFQVIARIDRYGFSNTFVLCEGCGLTFLNPRPTAAGYGTFYKDIYRPLLTSYLGFSHSPKDLLQEQERYAARTMRLLEEASVLSPDMRCADLGGSTGVLAKKLQVAGVDCLVVDPAPDELELARAAGLSTEMATAETWNPGDDRYDLIFVCRTVDHLLSVRSTLERIRSYLKPDGFLFMDIVDFEVTAECVRDYRNLLKLDHCFYLTDTTTRAYFSTIGFRVARTDMTTGTISYVCQRSEPTRVSAQDGRYAQDLSRLLRLKLWGYPPADYPVDLLTRVARGLRNALGNRKHRDELVDL